MRGKKRLYFAFLVVWVVLSAWEILSVSSDPTLRRDFFIAMGTDYRIELAKIDFVLVLIHIAGAILFRFVVFRRPVRSLPLVMALYFVNAFVLVTLWGIFTVGSHYQMGWAATVMFYYLHSEILNYERAKPVEESAQEA